MDATSLGVLWVSIGIALTILLQAQSRRMGSIDKELASSREALYTSVTELQLANTKLRDDQRTKARALKQCSGNMASTVNEILAAADTLKEKSDAGAATAEHYSEAIINAAKQLDGMIGSLNAIATGSVDPAPAEAPATRPAEAQPVAS